jgi:hypothetical protein
VQISLLFILLQLSTKFCYVLGSLIFFALSLLWGQLPVVSKLTGLADWVIRPTLLFKITAWIVSSSGLLVGYGIYYMIYGFPSSRTEFFLILFMSMALVSNILHNMLLFLPDMTPSPEHSIKQFYGNKIRVSGNVVELGGKEYSLMSPSLSRALFVDRYAIDMISISTAFSIGIFAAGHLNLLGSVGESAPGLADSIRATLSLLNLGGVGASPFTGQIWSIAASAFTIVLFFITVLYLQLASSTVDDVEERWRQGSVSAVAEATPVAAETPNKSSTQAIVEPPPPVPDGVGQPASIVMPRAEEKATAGASSPVHAAPPAPVSDSSIQSKGP